METAPKKPRAIETRAARTTWRELVTHLPAEWDGGDLGYLVSDMDAALKEADRQITSIQRLVDLNTTGLVSVTAIQNILDGKNA